MDSKLIKHKAFPKPSLLKDYLMDDMSSCSSNGFKSFPRRQCCPTTVRFLIDIDIDHKKYFVFKKNPSKSAASAFHRFIAAVKRLPFASPEKKPILPRNLSTKILRKSIFWKRKSSHKEIRRLKSFDQLMKEESPPLDIPNGSVMTSDFTASDACSSGNSSSQVNSNFTEVKRKEEDEDEDEVEALKNGDVSADSTNKSSTEEKQWSVSEEKEQFSPVSVLDCPFDDDEEVSSPFKHIQGSRKPKIERFECHAAVEPLNLSKRFESIESAGEEDGDEVKLAEQKAMDLVHQVMDSTLPSDKLLLDFFKEKIMSRQRGDDDLIREAESWINGTTLIRGAYVEESREWRCFDEEIGEMAMELEAVVLDALLDELVVDISSATIV